MVDAHVAAMLRTAVWHAKLAHTEEGCYGVAPPMAAEACTQQATAGRSPLSGRAADVWADVLVAEGVLARARIRRQDDRGWVLLPPRPRQKTAHRVELRARLPRVTRGRPQGRRWPSPARESRRCLHARGTLGKQNGTIDARKMERAVLHPAIEERVWWVRYVA